MMKAPASIANAVHSGWTSREPTNFSRQKTHLMPLRQAARISTLQMGMDLLQLDERSCNWHDVILETAKNCEGSASMFGELSRWKLQERLSSRLWPRWEIGVRRQYLSNDHGAQNSFGITTARSMFRQTDDKRFSKMLLLNLKENRRSEGCKAARQTYMTQRKIHIRIPQTAVWDAAMTFFHSPRPDSVRATTTWIVLLWCLLGVLASLMTHDSSATAAICTSSQQNDGQIRHFEAKMMWVRDGIAAHLYSVHKVLAASNQTDWAIKYLPLRG